MIDTDKLKCWYNGEIVGFKDIHISILDFGFIHCDATYDVMRSYGNNILNFDLHHQRFLESCKYFGFKPIENLNSIGKELIKINDIEQGFIWACVWRGAPSSGNPRDLSAPQKSVVYIKPYYGLKTSNDGLKLTIIEDFCRVPSVCYDQKSKNFGWIEFNLAQRKAAALGYDSALLLNPKGEVTEGPGFGVCFSTGSAIVTPIDDCLDSVTIKVVEKICRSQKIPFKRRIIEKNELNSFESAFACSTSGGVTPIESIDGILYEKNDSFNLPILFSQHLHEQGMR